LTVPRLTPTIGRTDEGGEEQRRDVDHRVDALPSRQDQGVGHHVAAGITPLVGPF
jgi:hypothetical protein